MSRTSDFEVVAVVPAKPLHEAKRRLSVRLSASERARLALDLFQRTLGAVLASQAVSRCLVVSPDPVVLEIATSAGAIPLHRWSAGQSAAYDDACAYLRDSILKDPITSPVAVLALAADLPLVQPAEIAGLVAWAGAAPGVVVAPDRHDDGTNALLLRPMGIIPFRFGPPGSFRRHQEEAASRGIPCSVYRAPGLALDLDTPEDLDQWQAIARAQPLTGDG